MADTDPSVAQPPRLPHAISLNEARALARERFKTRLLAGEKVGECACADDEPAAVPASAAEPAARVAGVRFRDSGQTYYFAPGGLDLAVGDWVVVETGRGREAGRVVIAPRQVRLQALKGAPSPVHRKLTDDDVRRMEGLKSESAEAVRLLGSRARALGLAIKPISAEFGFDGSSVVLNYSTPERGRAPEGAALKQLARDIAGALGCRVELRQVGPRDEARLLGGLGRCGRTLCCSSWLPVYPEISMNMAKTQDLPLNPAKVSGVCGRLLCCLSYENEQYKQMKAVMPRLGQTVETPAGPGMVVALQLLKDLVTVRLVADGTEATFSGADLGLGGPGAESRRPAGGQSVEGFAEAPPAAAEEPGGAEEPVAENGTEESSGAPTGRRRRRRRGSGRGSGRSSGG